MIIHLTSGLDSRIWFDINIYRCSSRFPTSGFNGRSGIVFVQVWSTPVDRRAREYLSWLLKQRTGTVYVDTSSSAFVFDKTQSSDKSLCINPRLVTGNRGFWQSCLLPSKSEVIQSFWAPCFHVPCTSAPWGLPVPRKWCHCGRHPSRSWGTTVIFWCLLVRCFFSIWRSRLCLCCHDEPMFHIGTWYWMMPVPNKYSMSI